MNNFRCIIAFACTIALAILLASCGGKRYGDLQRLDLTVPGPTSVRLNTIRAFEIQRGTVNTYERYVDGEPWRPTTRTLSILNPDLGIWRMLDSTGNSLDFLVRPEEGVYLLGAINRQRGGWAVMETPLLYTPPIMEQNQPTLSTGTFLTASDEFSTRTGTMDLSVMFTGIEDIQTPLGAMENCARIDSIIQIKLALGLSAKMTQRQWLHRQYGEVVRDYDIAFQLLGIGVKKITARHLITASHPPISQAPEFPE